MKSLPSSINIASAVLISAFSLASVSAAGSTVIVTSPSSQGWSTADTRPGGSVAIDANYGAPAGFGNEALDLTTDATTTAKAQLLHATSTPLSQVSSLSYYTYQKPQLGEFAGADASYQLPVYLDGTPASFTTLVYEPYENGTVVPSVWQNWDVAAGMFWSTRSVTTSTGSVVAGHGGAPFYTLAQLKASFPNAVVIGYGVNIGSNNPNYTVGVDGFVFNDTTYNFESRPVTKDDCKNGGYKNYSNPSFKNQGQCIKSLKNGNGDDSNSDGEKSDDNSARVMTSTF